MSTTPESTTTTNQLSRIEIYRKTLMDDSKMKILRSDIAKVSSNLLEYQLRPEQRINKSLNVMKSTSLEIAQQTRYNTTEIIWQMKHLCGNQWPKQSEWRIEKGLEACFHQTSLIFDSIKRREGLKEYRLLFSNKQGVRISDIVERLQEFCEKHGEYFPMFESSPNTTGHYRKEQGEYVWKANYRRRTKKSEPHLE